jgi:hypothetical protein
MAGPDTPLKDGITPGCSDGLPLPVAPCTNVAGSRLASPGRGHLPATGARADTTQAGILQFMWEKRR